MPKNSDFQKIYDKFVKEYGSEKGKSTYFAWVNKKGYDDTKSMTSQKEERDSIVFGIEYKEDTDSFIVKGIIATTHMDNNSVLGGEPFNDKIERSTLEKWAKEINEGNPRANKVSLHHDRGDKTVIGVGVKGSAKVVPVDKQWGLYVESEINKTHDKFDNVKYQVEHSMLDAHSIEFLPPSNPLFETLAGTQVRYLDDSTELHGWTLGSRPINEHAVILKEVMPRESEEMKKVIMKESTEDQIDSDTMSTKEGNTMAEESIAVQVSAAPVASASVQTKEFDAKEVASLVTKQLIESKEFKEELAKMKIENKAMLNRDERKEILEMKEWREALESKGAVSVDEQFKRAGKLAEKSGLISKYLNGQLSSKSAETKAAMLEFKNFGTNGRKLEYKNLGMTTNQNTDTDYLLSAAELADVFDPVIYNLLNEKATTWNLLQKDDYSQKGNNQVQFTVKNAANTTAAFYSGNTVVTANTTRLKFMTKFKKAQVGVAVDGDMIAAARGGPIGDVFAQEVQDASETLLSIMNIQLFAATGLETASTTLGFNYIADSATNTTLYNLTRAGSTGNRLGPDTATDTYITGSSANITLALLRQAIRYCVIDGSNLNDLVFVVHPIQADKIKALFDDQRRMQQPTDTRFGFQTQLWVDGVPVFVDKDATSSVITLFDQSAHRVAMWIPPTLEMLGKRSDSEEGFIKTYYAVYNRAPRRLVQIYSLATT